MSTMQTIGSRAQVWHHTAKHTSGGLTRSQLMMNKHGRIVSKRMHASGKRNISHLRKHGYIAKKGTFALFQRCDGRAGTRRRRRGSRRGGMSGSTMATGQLNPGNF